MSVIAERQFEIRTGNDVRPAYLKLHQPREHEKGDWMCEFELPGFANSGKRHAIGIDSFQALFLAMKKATVQLEISEEFEAGSLYCFDEPVRNIEENLGKGLSL